MLHKSILAVALLCAAACGPTTTEPARVRADRAAHHESTPTPPDTTTLQGDTTSRGGGTIGSGT